MLNFSSLYSGSTGNSLFLQTDNTNLLIDAGVSAKKITEALASFNVNMEDIDAIIVTHEHIDHVQSIGTLSKKYNLPVYATKETFDAMPKQTEKILYKNINFINSNENFEINDLTIKPFSIPHDAINPVGYTIFNKNKKISIATDIGNMTLDILNTIEGSSFLLLESNYDPEILKLCSYPYHLKERIAGNNGHLPNYIAGRTIAYLINTGLSQVVLGHLSKESNFPELAYKTVINELIKKDIDLNNIDLSVASRTEPTKLFKLLKEYLLYVIYKYNLCWKN